MKILKEQDEFDLQILDQKEYFFDNKWDDWTEAKGSDIRRNTFKVFGNYFTETIINLFQAYKSTFTNEIYYHVIENDMSDNQVGKYSCLTRKEIEEKFGLKF